MNYIKSRNVRDIIFYLLGHHKKIYLLSKMNIKRMDEIFIDLKPSKFIICNFAYMTNENSLQRACLEVQFFPLLVLAFLMVLLNNALLY